MLPIPVLMLHHRYRYSFFWLRSKRYWYMVSVSVHSYSSFILIWWIVHWIVDWICRQQCSRKQRIKSNGATRNPASISQTTLTCQRPPQALSPRADPYRRDTTPMWVLTPFFTYKQPACFKLSVKLQDSRRTRKHWKSGSPSMNLGVAKKLSKRKQKKIIWSQFWRTNLQSRCTLLTFSDCMSSVLSKKGSAISVSWVVQELPLS